MEADKKPCFAEPSRRKPGKISKSLKSCSFHKGHGNRERPIKLTSYRSQPHFGGLLSLFTQVPSLYAAARPAPKGWQRPPPKIIPRQRNKRQNRSRGGAEEGRAPTYYFLKNKRKAKCRISGERRGGAAPPSPVPVAPRSKPAPGLGAAACGAGGPLAGRSHGC